VRSGTRLSRRERAGDLVRDTLGSWSGIGVSAILLAGGTTLALHHDRAAGPVAAVGLILLAVALLAVQLVLMAAVRADRTAAEWALRELDTARRTAAALVELRREVDQVRTELARLAARVERDYETKDPNDPR
jgi:hypothetical protein